MTSSVGAASAALSGRGIRKDEESTDYQIILPALPTGPAVLNTVFLHADVRGRPYRVVDFRDALNRLALLPEVVALGAYQMNHVWAVTLKSPEGKRKTLAAGDLVVKERRCIVVDPGDRAVRIKLHWLLHHIPDDEVREALAPYGKVTEVAAEKWRVQGFLGCGSMTRTAVIRLKPGLTLEDLPHQLRVAGGLALVVAPGRAPLCLRCQRTGHIRRDCLVPKCGACHRFGHDTDHCVKTYATATGSGRNGANAELLMDEVEAEDVTKGAVSANASSAAKPVEGDRVAADPTPQRVGPLSAAASVEQKAAEKKDAEKACGGETTTRENRATTRSEEPPVVNDDPRDNEVHMADASTLAMK